MYNNLLGRIMIYYNIFLSILNLYNFILITCIITQDVTHSGGGSYVHVERLYSNDDQGEHYYKYGEHYYEHGDHAYNIHVKHEYVKHESQYMPTGPVDTFVL
jgi:hypothetical protein